MICSLKNRPNLIEFESKYSLSIYSVGKPCYCFWISRIPTHIRLRVDSCDTGMRGKYLLQKISPTEFLFVTNKFNKVHLTKEHFGFIDIMTFGHDKNYSERMNQKGYLRNNINNKKSKAFKDYFY